MDVLQFKMDDGDSSLITDSSSACPDTGFERPSAEQRMFSSLNQQRLNRKTTNVVIECNGIKYPAHNYVLACRSNYFYKKFCWEEEEGANAKNQTPTVVLNDYHPTVMDVIIEYIYTDAIDLLKISDEKLEMLILCGRSLEVIGLEACLLKELVDNLKPMNFHLGLALAKATNDASAEVKILLYVCQHLEGIWSSPEFGALEEDHLHYIFENRAAILSCHDVLLECLLKWVRKDEETREGSLARLLGHINFNKITKLEACSVLHNQLVYNKPPLKEEVVRVIRRDSCDEEYSDISVHEDIPQELPKPVQVTNREHAAPTLLFIGRGDQNSCHALTYDVSGDQWYQPCDLELSLDQRQGIGYDGQNLFFIGGADVNDVKQNSCVLFNYCTRTKHALPELRIARSDPLVFPFDGSIYVIGGSGRYSNEGLSHGEYLSDIYSMVWKVMQPMRVKRNGSATACVFNSYIYVAGGGTGEVERYLTTHKTWDLLAPVSERDFHDGNVHISAAAGRVCAIRFYKPNFILMYNHERNNWETEMVRGTPPEFVAHTVGWGSKIFTLDQENRVFILDVAAYMWFELTKVPARYMAYPHYLNLF